MEMPTTWNPCAPYCCCHLLNSGISSWHGAHHVAQKFSRTTLPRRLLRSTCAPFKSVRAISGARLFTSDFAAGTAAKLACATTPARKVLQMNRFSTLVTAFNGIALFNPVAAKIIGDIKNLHIRVAHALQQLICRGYIRAATPRAAAAIENDEFVFRQ